MLDGVVRQHLDPLMDRMGWALAGRGVTANAVTVAGCVIGIAAFVLIWQQYYLAGLVLLLISRLGDGLDGAVARVRGKTDYGGYLDIVLDFSFYGLIPLGFVLADPANNAVAGGVLIFSFYINGSSFLAYAIMAEKTPDGHRCARPEITLLHHRPGRGDRDNCGFLRKLPVPAVVCTDRLRFRGAVHLHDDFAYRSCRAGFC